MFREFFGLQRKPFSKTPDPAFLYPGRRHEEALARLQYAVEEKELCLLTGDVGCGKTTITRKLMDVLDPAHHRVVLLINPRISATQFLAEVAAKMGIKVRRPRRDALTGLIQERVYEDYLSGITPVIILDEAQLIPRRETFEEIRLLTNFQLDDSNLICVILVGQTELRDRLQRPVHEPLRQRIGMAYHLGPLGIDETRAYVAHRLSIAGRSEPLFTDAAIDALHRHSGGVPRLVNSIANVSLLAGMGHDAEVIDETIVNEAAGELGFTAGHCEPRRSASGTAGKATGRRT